MTNNKKTILILIILILLGFAVSFGNYIFFIGSFQFLSYTIFAGIIFSCFQANKNLYKYLSINFIASVIFSFTCVFGERFFMIFYNLLPTNQYSAEHFRGDLQLAFYLTIFFFIATIAGFFIKKFLIKYKEWFLVYKK